MNTVGSLVVRTTRKGDPHACCANGRYIASCGPASTVEHLTFFTLDAASDVDHAGVWLPYASWEEERCAGDMLGGGAEIGAEQMREGAAEQACADQQHEGDRDLNGRALRSLLAAGGSVDVALGRHAGWRNAESARSGS